PDTYFQDLRREYEERRDFLVGELNRLGLPTWVPQGAYFAISDIRQRKIPDRDFCRDLTTRVGVAAIPLSPFYDPQGDAPPALIRCGFCKQKSTLEAAVQRLARGLQ